MTLKDCTQAVGLFHTTYGLRHETAPTVDITPEEMLLRHKLMAEENDEYLSRQAGTWSGGGCAQGHATSSVEPWCPMACKT